MHVFVHEYVRFVLLLSGNMCMGPPMTSHMRIFSLFFLCFHIPLCQKTRLCEGVGSVTLYS